MKKPTAMGMDQADNQGSWIPIYIKADVKGNQAAPSLVEGLSAFSQFYRMAYQPIYQFKAEKITNPLGELLFNVASILDPVLHSLFPKSYANTALRFCSQKIITFGKVRQH
jgi:hypothetical protein